MNLKRKKFLWLALGGMILLLTGTPQAYSDDISGQDEHPRAEMRAKFKAKMEERIKEMHKELGLSEDQQKELDAHREQQAKDREEFFGQMRSKRKELAQELQKPELNLDRVKVIHSEIKEMMNKKADQKLEHILYVRKILTPEQFSKFMGLMEKHKNQWREKGSKDWRGGKREKGPASDRDDQN
ncbi:MAG: Spy/CpxP family protein refolding chaperone [Candidatus Omnitrophota bacterium]